MPTVEFSIGDLSALLGKKVSAGELEDALLYAKGELESVEGEMVKADIKDTNRPDLWSVEGIARELRGHYGLETGVPRFKVASSGISLKVSRGVEGVRPKTVAAAVKGLELNDYAIRQIIQLQEKIHQTYGQKRSSVAVGIYDLDRVKPPVSYTSVKPDGIKFVPLDSEREMTPAEILEKHPKGIEYRHLLKGFKEYPLMIDSGGNVLSIPPIINSSYTGKVTPETRNVFIELTGHELERLSIALNVVVTALAERGGSIYSVDVIYPSEEITTPDLTPQKFRIDKKYCNRTLGLELGQREIIALLKKARYDAAAQGNRVELRYSAYRNDIMHQRDVVEDIAIAYGVNRIKPEPPKIATVGSVNRGEEFADAVRELMVGLGFQEILTFSLTDKNNLFRKMELEEGKVCEIANPVSISWSVLRNWLMPSMLEFLTHNLHVEYPHRIFEVGDVVEIDEKAETKTRVIKKLACVVTNNVVTYEEISSALDAVFRNLGIDYNLKKGSHSSFVFGRASRVFTGKKELGVMGEIHPQVLNNWKLEKPAVGFEIELP
ncbi:MAG: phenylalanine--tRNA ligase subunit beta [Candidatus Hydrothermarchaeaceae archaeon]